MNRWVVRLLGAVVACLTASTSALGGDLERQVQSVVNGQLTGQGGAPITKAGVVGVVVGQSYGYQAFSNGQFQLVFHLSQATAMEVTVYVNCIIRKDITLQPGETLNLEVEVKQCSAITGALFGAVTDVGTGSPVDGAQVQATRGASTTTTSTGWNGNYMFPQLDAGSYVVTVSKTNYNSSTSFATILESETTRTNLLLTPFTGSGNTSACAGASSKAPAGVGDAVLLIMFPSMVGVLALLKTVWPRG